MPVLQNLVDVIQFFARIEFVHHIVDELQIFQHQVARRNFLLLAEIDQLAVEPIARRPPLVLHDQRAAIETESLVRGVQLVQLGDGGLNQRRQRDGLVHPHGNVAHPEFQRVEEWMRPNVPPDFLGVVDAVGLDQQLDEIFVLAPAGKVIRNIGARKLVEHFAAIRFQPRVHPQPERGIGRKRQDVRQKIAGVIHQLDRGLAVFNANVHVQPEDQVGPRHQLQVFDNVLVALVG